MEFTLQAGEKSVTADGEDIGLTAKNADVVTRALNYGKEGNLVSRYKANKDMKTGSEGFCHLVDRRYQHCEDHIWTRTVTS